MRFGAIVAFVLLLEGITCAADTGRPDVDRIFAAYNEPVSPGCALGVIQDGSFIYRRGYGLASLELNVPLSPQSVFYMGSVSKQFTAASVVLAAEQGFLSLDDNIRKYIPELPDYGHPVTLRQMLHHTSGLRDILGLLAISGKNALDLHPTGELIDMAARQKALNYPPGEEYLYSNTNYFLLAEVVNRATKKPLSVFANENIFRPLGMTHSRFYDDHTIVVPDRVPAYAPGKNGSFLVDWSTNYDTVGGGGMMSSVDDLLLWDRNFYENKLGKGTLLKELQTPGVLNSGKKTGYALGLEIGRYRGLPVVEHGGDLFGYHTAILRFPEQRFTVLCLCNVADANPVAYSRQVADIYLDKNLQAAQAPVRLTDSGTPSDLSPLAGTYHDNRYHSLRTFSFSDGSLKRVGPDRFENGPLAVVFDRSGKSVKVTVSEDGEPLFEGAKIDPLSNTDLAAYAGIYKSTELDATYKLSVKNESLVLLSNWNPPRKLKPIATDEFDGGALGTLVFRRDTNGRVTGLSLFAGRVRDIAFEKTN